MGGSVEWLLGELKWLLTWCVGLFKREVPKSEAGQDDVYTDQW